MANKNYRKYVLYIDLDGQDLAAVHDLLERAGRKKSFLILLLLSAFVERYPDFPVDSLTKRQLKLFLLLNNPRKEGR